MIVDTEVASTLLDTGRLYEYSLKVILENQSSTGAFIASPNFSQYKYSWFRDGSFIALALAETARPETIAASGRFHAWVNAIIQRYRSLAEQAIAKVKNGQELNPVTDVLHCRYTVEGLPSMEDWTPFQIDGFGTWLFALAEYCKVLDGATVAQELAAYSDSIILLVAYLEALWQVPNFDCWEEHGDKIATSTLAALYGGLSRIPELAAYLPEDTRLAEAATSATKTAAEIKAYILQNGIATAETGGQRYLTKFCGGADPGELAGAVDANLLWVAVPYGLLPVDDPLIQNTVERIIKDLIFEQQLNGLAGVHRYARDTYYGGGEWLLLTAWLAMVRLAGGDADGAKTLSNWIEKQAEANGDLPEQTFEHLNRPDMSGYWKDLWGEVATPLVWSHASYISLVNRLRAAGILLTSNTEA
ncbi:MAG TPA: glycoside hydrolase family 15 protein [Chloroflexia bacterium]|nr:glycoside hydrolase family 15 protein [Chloroflexia bacterium]